MDSAFDPSRLMTLRALTTALAQHFEADARRPGPAALIEALRYKLTSTPAPEFGGLPIVQLLAPLPTMRPPDAVIVQSTMISGATTFAEVVDIAAIAQMSDPVKEGVVALVRAQGAELPTQ